MSANYDDLTRRFHELRTKRNGLTDLELAELLAAGQEILLRRMVDAASIDVGQRAREANDENSPLIVPSEDLRILEGNVLCTHCGGFLEGACLKVPIESHWDIERITNALRDALDAR